MSKENVELVRRVYELWNRGDLDAAVEMLDQHVVWNAYVHLPDSRPRHGVHEVQQWAGEFAEAWGEIQVQIKRLEEVGDDLVLALVRMTGRGRGSGAAVESGVDGHVWTVRDRKVVPACLDCARKTPGTWALAPHPPSVPTSSLAH
jgi:ketosteroid isomerase-like protein